jgi:hypothetical protein
MRSACILFGAEIDRRVMQRLSYASCLGIFLRLLATARKQRESFGAGAQILLRRTAVRLWSNNCALVSFQ